MSNLNESIKNIKDHSDLEKIRKMVNEAIDNRKKSLDRRDEAIVLARAPFGYIKEAMEFMIPSLFNSSKGRTLIGQYVNIVKGDSGLKNQHTVYENIRKAGAENCSTLLNEMSSYVNDSKVDNIELDKIRNIVAEAYMMTPNIIKEDLPKGHSKAFYESVEYIATHKKQFENLADYAEKTRIIEESVKNSDDKYSFDDSQTLIEHFNKTYSSLNTEDFDLVKEIVSISDKEEIFNKYKKKCIRKLNEAKAKFDSENDSETANKIDGFISALKTKLYSKERANEDIANIIALDKLF